MRWRADNGVEWLEASLPGATAVFSSRSSGCAKQSHRLLAAALGIDPGRIAVNRQVHGAELVCAEGPPGDVPEADGHVIREPGRVGLVYGADCLPVALAGPGGVALLHCGWRGLAAGIVARGAAAVEATDAAVGPGIGSCCYEVGSEVLDAFADLGNGVATGRMLDLTEVTRRLLRQAGVQRVETAGLCTSCDEGRFFSYRREADQAGRQAGLAWVEPASSEEA